MSLNEIWFTGTNKCSLAAALDPLAYPSRSARPRNSLNLT